MGEIEYYQKHIKITQKKIETLELKKENCSSNKFEDVLSEIKILKEIEDFLLGKLG